MTRVLGLLCVAACASAPAPSPPAAAPVAPRPIALQPMSASRPVVLAALTPSMVLETIRTRYLPGVQRCYRTHLKRDNRARGRVMVSFTVDPQGQARNSAARGITGRVDGCIAAQVARWQFPAPPRPSRFALRLQLSTK